MSFGFGMMLPHLLLTVFLVKHGETTIGSTVWCIQCRSQFPPDRPGHWQKGQPRESSQSRCAAFSVAPSKEVSDEQCLWSCSRQEKGLSWGTGWMFQCRSSCRSFKSLSFQDKNPNSLPVLKKLASALISALLDDGMSFFYRVRELELCDQCAHVPTSLGRDIWFAVEIHHGSLNLQDAAVGTCSRAWFASCLWCQYVCASDTPWF